MFSFLFFLFFFLWWFTSSRMSRNQLPRGSSPHDATDINFHFSKPAVESSNFLGFSICTRVPWDQLISLDCMTSLFHSWHYILCDIIEALRILVVTDKFTINKQLLSINIDYLEAMQISCVNWNAEKNNNYKCYSLWAFISWYVRLFNLLIAGYLFKSPLWST